MKVGEGHAVTSCKDQQGDMCFTSQRLHVSSVAEEPHHQTSLQVMNMPALPTGPGVQHKQDMT
jgi:hypothetical protein